MEDGLLALKWNDHKDTFIQSILNFREQALYSDVTLACKGQYFHTHKILLSSCSEYFQEILSMTQCKKPVIILKDIRPVDVKRLLEYIYMGEVEVRQSELSDLIEAAECLKIKGLAAPDDDKDDEVIRKKKRKRQFSDERIDSPKKQLSDDRIYSPKKQLSDDRIYSPKKQLTDYRLDSPKKQLSDYRLDSPQKQLCNRIDSPKKQLPDIIDSPKNLLSDRVDSPKKLLSDRLDSPKKQLSDRLDSPKNQLSARLDSPKKQLSDRLESPIKQLSQKPDSPKKQVQSSPSNIQNITSINSQTRRSTRLNEPEVIKTEPDVDICEERIKCESDMDIENEPANYVDNSSIPAYENIGFPTAAEIELQNENLELSNNSMPTVYIPEYESAAGPSLISEESTFDNSTLLDESYSNQDVAISVPSTSAVGSAVEDSDDDKGVLEHNDGDLGSEKDTPSTIMEKPDEPARYDVEKVEPKVNDLCQVSELVKKLLQRVEEVKAQNKHILEYIRNISTEDNVKDDYQFDSLPIKSMEELKDLEKEIENEQIFNSLVKHLSMIGGFDLKSAIYNILQCLLAHEVSVKLNWLGRGNKAAFKPLQLNKVVRKAVRINTSFRNADENTIENYIKRFLKYASDRNGGRNKRMIKSQMKEMLN